MSPVVSNGALLCPSLSLQDSAPHTTTWVWAPGTQRPIHDGKSILFSLVCLQQMIELDLKLQATQLNVVYYAEPHLDGYK